MHGGKITATNVSLGGLWKNKGYENSTYSDCRRRNQNCPITP